MCDGSEENRERATAHKEATTTRRSPNEQENGAQVRWRLRIARKIGRYDESEPDCEGAEPNKNGDRMDLTHILTKNLRASTKDYDSKLPLLASL